MDRHYYGGYGGYGRYGGWGGGWGYGRRLSQTGGYGVPGGRGYGPGGAGFRGHYVHRPTTGGGRKLSAVGEDTASGRSLLDDDDEQWGGYYGSPSLLLRLLQPLVAPPPPPPPPRLGQVKQSATARSPIPSPAMPVTIVVRALLISYTPSSCQQLCADFFCSCSRSFDTLSINSSARFGAFK